PARASAYAPAATAARMGLGAAEAGSRARRAPARPAGRRTTATAARRADRSARIGARAAAKLGSRHGARRPPAVRPADGGDLPGGGRRPGDDRSRLRQPAPDSERDRRG